MPAKINKTVKKILIVEDELNLGAVLQSSFKDEGFLVIVAKDGKEGLLLTEKEKPDLILLDILMPNMNGIEMAIELRKNNFKKPIIFLTNLKDFDSISQAVKVPFSDYVIKSDMPIEKIIELAKQRIH